MPQKNKRITKSLNKKAFNSTIKNARSKVVGTYIVEGNYTRYNPLTWEEIDAIPCIGEEDC